MDTEEKVNDRFFTFLEKEDPCKTNKIKYPCSLVHLCRIMLLDCNQKLYIKVNIFLIIRRIVQIYAFYFCLKYKTWNKIANLLEDGIFKDCQSNSNNYKWNMYKNIISSYYVYDNISITEQTSFNRLIDALKIPVFTAEVNINYN